MNGFVKFVAFFTALALGNLIYKLNQGTPVVPLPETWWGPGHQSTKTGDDSIRPFEIHIPDKVLQDLKHRLTNAKSFTKPLEGIQQQYGINTVLLKEIVDFWLNKYDWRQREKFLNQYPQYKTKIQGLDIHFIRVKPNAVPNGMKVLPLLLLHGWPGSVREFYEIIPLLTKVHKDKDFVFELIIPSLPGYGFSDAAVKPGLGAPQIAVIFKTLMVRLGFPQFYVQGGDWGSAIGSALGTLYPENVKGVHLNMCFSNMPISNLKLILGSFWPRMVVDQQHEHRLYPLGNLISYSLLEFGYMHLQATKPDTIGVALNDSPVGLAAYILEKFTTWTNPEWKTRPDGGLKEKFTYTQLLDNVMIYWVTNSITSSMRLYAETINKDQNVFQDHSQIQSPSACALFDKELIYQPKYIFKHKHTNLVHTAEYSGGHFAAFEAPEALAEDVFIAVAKFENGENKK